MDRISIQLIVYFEEPFWVGVFEKVEYDQLQVSRMIFGKEPMSEDILQFIYKQYNRLHFSPNVEVKVKSKTVQPKRLQREVKKQIQKHGVGTKSQQALQLQYELTKQVRGAQAKIRLDAMKQMKFEKKQQKRKEKHRGH